MQRFHFSLQRMKDFKDEVLDKEKNTLLRMRKERDRLEAQIAACAARYGALNTEMVRRTQEGISVVEMRGYRFQLENIHRQEEDLAEQKERAEARIERQLQVVVAASQEVAGLDKLRDRQLEEYRYQVQKAEEQVIAEFVSTKLVRERSATNV